MWRAPASGQGSGSGGRRERAQTVGREHPQSKKGRKAREAEDSQEATTRQGRSKHQLTSKDKGLHKLIKLLIKITLNSSQRVRELVSVVFVVAIIRTDSSVVQAMRQAGQNYNDGVEKAKEEGVEHNLGAPLPHVWMAGLEALKEEDVGQANKLELKKAFDEMSAQSMEEVATTVKLFKLEKCYDTTFSKIVYAVPSLQSVLSASFKQLGAKVKVGKAPAGAMERELAEWLKDLLED